jgi:hypothetical protein
MFCTGKTPALNSLLFLLLNLSVLFLSVAEENRKNLAEQGFFVLPEGLEPSAL